MKRNVTDRVAKSETPGSDKDSLTACGTRLRSRGFRPNVGQYYLMWSIDPGVSGIRLRSRGLRPIVVLFESIDPGDYGIDPGDYGRLSYYLSRSIPGIPAYDFDPGDSGLYTYLQIPISGKLTSGARARYTGCSSARARLLNCVGCPPKGHEPARVPARADAKDNSSCRSCSAPEERSGARVVCQQSPSGGRVAHCCLHHTFRGVGPRSDWVRTGHKNKLGF